MNDRLLYCSITLLAVLLSCNKTEITNQEAKQVITITASFVDSGTKTTVENGGTSVLWEQNDEIAVFFDGTKSKLASTLKSPAGVSSFKGTFNGLIGLWEGFSSSKPLLGLYPYRDEATADNITITTRLDSIQVGKLGSFAQNTNIGVAKSTDLTMAFYNVCGGIRFTVTHEGVNEVVFTGNNNEDIAGKIRIGFEDNMPSIKASSDRAKSISLRAPNNSTFTIGKWYYIVALPVKLEEGYKLIFKTETQHAILENTSAVSIERGIFGSLACADEGLTYTDTPKLGIEIHNKTKGGLLNELSEYELEKIEHLRVTGELNDIDCLVFSTKLPNLKYLDLAEVNLTSMPSKAFYNTTSIETVILPQSLEIIGKSSFENSKIKTISLPASVKEIKERAFANCSELTNVSIDENSSLSTIRGGYDDSPLGAFYNCKSLMEIFIPSSVSQIGASAFAGCKSLGKIVFGKGICLDCISGPETTNDKGSGVFSGCTIEEIEIPASVETIGRRAFYYSSIQKITFESGSRLKKICGGYNDGSSYGAFYNTDIKSITIPKSVEIIENEAFKNSSLQEITFEEGSLLNKIGGDCYKGLYWGAFANSAIKTITIPKGITNIEASTFYHCEQLESVFFEEGSQLKSIDGYIYNYLSGIHYDIGVYGAFMGCTKLARIDIPSSVEEIGYAAFSGCTGLTSITFGNNSALKKIKGGYLASEFDDYYKFEYCGAFQHCSSLKSIIIPANVETIGACAFRNCTNLESVSFEPGSKITRIEGGYKHYYIKQYYLSREYDIYYGAFAGAKKIWLVDMSNATNLSKIDDYVFYNSPILIFKIGTISPPACGSNTFASLADNSVLKVPDGSAEQYKYATGWKNFSSISGMNE